MLVLARDEGPIADSPERPTSGLNRDELNESIAQPRSAPISMSISYQKLSVGIA